MYHLYTFDVFDTLVTRRVAAPKGIFDIMQERLRTDNRYQEFNFMQPEFAAMRIKAEEQALEKIRLQGGEEVSFQEIYRHLSKLLHISFEMMHPLMKLEIAVEKENLFPVTTNVNRMKMLISQGKRVALISDMYLSENILRGLLISINPFFADIPIYVSSEWNRRKSTGHLFETVKEKEDIPYENWHHMGDNNKSDVAVPRKLGIHAEWFRFESLWPVEQDFLNKNYMKPFVQYALGTARKLRLANKEKPHPFFFGCTIGGVLLFSYVMWILQSCEKQGIQCLYFIARDGYLPKMVADRLIRLGRFHVKTHYIYGSRHAWRLPAYDGEDGSLRRLVIASQPDKIRSVKDLADLFQLEEKVVASYLPQVASIKEPFSLGDVGECIRSLEESKEFRGLLQKRHASQKLFVQSYLQQEINFGETFAFVDAGGWGYTQECFAKLLHPFYPKEIHTFAFYMGMGGYGRGCVFHNFCKKTYEPFLEPMLRALHGQTQAYAQEQGKFRPVFQDDECVGLSEYGYQDYVDGIQGFCDHFWGTFEAEIKEIDTDVIQQFLDDIKNHLGDAEFDFLMDMPYRVTGNEDRGTVFAPRLTKMDLREMFLFQKLGTEKNYSGINVSYSLLRVSDREKRKIHFYRRHASQVVERYCSVWKKHLRFPVKQKVETREESCLSGKRIVLYGAGKYGKQVYRFLKREPKVEMVAWLDREYKNLQKEGYPVNGDITVLEQFSYDIVVIGVLDVSEGIRNFLAQHGVPNDRILELL